MKLSILIPSVFERRHTFLPKCLDMVYSQYDRLTKEQQQEVEILVLVDNKKMSLGDKRNQLIDTAQGEYVVFIDDDDRISDDYIETLLAAIETKPDAITFLCSVSLNGMKPKICTYSIKFKQDKNLPKGYERLPNHICCVRRDLSQIVSFPSIKYGEDEAYAKLLKAYLKTEVHIDKVLYYYDYHQLTTVAQEDIPEVIRIRKANQPIVADVVILSNANTPELKAMTQKTVDTCLSGANGLRVNIIVVEQQPNVSYPGTTLVYHPAEFNYSAFNNLGATYGTADKIVFSNNDCLFKAGWLHNLLNANYPVVSPKCPNDSRQRHIRMNRVGYQNGVNLSPWCFMIERELFNDIGGWDEDFRGWFADDSLIGRLKKKDVKPMLVHDSYVEHLGSITTKQMDPEFRSDFAWDRLELYNQRYNDNKFITNPNFLAWKQSKAK